MVHNKNQILDCGQLKNITEVIMPKEENYLSRCYRKPNRVFKKSVWDEDSCDYVNVEETNPDPKPWFPKLDHWFKHDERKLTDDDYRGIYTQARRTQAWMKFQSENLEEILAYLDIIPFIPCMMFNISPNWKGQLDTKLKRKKGIKYFREVIETYLKSCNRYSKWKYCIESGSEDNFIHAHVVAEINPQMMKSVLDGHKMINGKRKNTSHIGKGQHIADIRKIWDRHMPAGYVGLLKGKFAIQSVILRNEILRDDKLKYLREENKPEGHKNKRDLGLLFGEL